MHEFFLWFKVSPLSTNQVSRRYLWLYLMCERYVWYPVTQLGMVSSEVTSVQFSLNWVKLPANLLTFTAPFSHSFGLASEDNSFFPRDMDCCPEGNYCTRLVLIFVRRTVRVFESIDFLKVNGFKSFVDCCRTLAVFKFLSTFLPNSHSSDEKYFSISLKVALIFLGNEAPPNGRFVMF